MATQHPDHANVPYWKKNGEAFINTQEEIEECISAFRDLHCQEYMWDWEGKYVDEAAVDKHDCVRCIFTHDKIPSMKNLY